MNKYKVVAHLLAIIIPICLIHTAKTMDTRIPFITAITNDSEHPVTITFIDPSGELKWWDGSSQSFFSIDKAIEVLPKNSCQITIPIPILQDEHILKTESKRLDGFIDSPTPYCPHTEKDPLLNPDGIVTSVPMCLQIKTKRRMTDQKKSENSPTLRYQNATFNIVFGKFEYEPNSLKLGIWSQKLVGQKVTMVSVLMAFRDCSDLKSAAIFINKDGSPILRRIGISD
jgi:hypothetical protein